MVFIGRIDSMSLKNKLEESVARYHRLNVALDKLCEGDLEELTQEDTVNHFSQLAYIKKQVEQVERNILGLSIEKYTEV
ncbi:hypothetical protein VP501E541_P0240 [Vibrio phage 501E54-1]|nr:hypothetical protein VP501E541_P0240 [Vibrio phage 501E54-1]